MNKPILTTLAALTAALTTAQAVEIDLGPVADHFGSSVLYTFDNFNGPIPADGHVVFDLTFADNQFVRLTPRTFATPNSFAFIAFVGLDSVAIGQDIIFDTAPLFIYGAHFDLDLSAYVGQETITYAYFDVATHGFWAVGPHVPDTGSTLLLALLAALVILPAARRWHR